MYSKKSVDSSQFEINKIFSVFAIGSGIALYFNSYFKYIFSNNTTELTNYFSAFEKQEEQLLTSLKNSFDQIYNTDGTYNYISLAFNPFSKDVSNSSTNDETDYEKISIYRVYDVAENIKIYYFALLTKYNCHINTL